MKQAFVCLSVLLFNFSSVALCQTVPTVRIVGKVTDASTGEGLSNVNVFLDGTTLGTASGITGSFIIQNVPRGTYELVVSMVGYARLLIPIQIIDLQDREIAFEIKPIVIQTATVEVTARDPTEWREHLERFQQEFFGETSNAKECTILNPEILDFSSDRNRNAFHADTDQTLKIENFALGYRVMFYWEEFRVEQGILQFKSKTKFDDLQPRSEDEYLRWQENRRASYIGSKKHFLSSLARGVSQEEGFEIIYLESLDLSERVLKRSQRVDDMKMYVQETGEAFRKKLSFPNYWQVIYKRVPPEQRYRIAFDRDDIRAKWQISWITLEDAPVLFDITGELEDPYTMTVYGYWAFKRLADLLPSDYQVP